MCVRFRGLVQSCTELFTLVRFSIARLLIRAYCGQSNSNLEEFLAIASCDAQDGEVCAIRNGQFVNMYAPIWIPLAESLLEEMNSNAAWLCLTVIRLATVWLPCQAISFPWRLQTSKMSQRCFGYQVSKHIKVCWFPQSNGMFLIVGWYVYCLLVCVRLCMGMFLVFFRYHHHGHRTIADLCEDPGEVEEPQGSEEPPAAEEWG